MTGSGKIGNNKEIAAPAVRPSDRRAFNTAKESQELNEALVGAKLISRAPQKDDGSDLSVEDKFMWEVAVKLTKSSNDPLYAVMICKYCSNFIRKMSAFRFSSDTVAKQLKEIDGGIRKLVDDYEWGRKQVDGDKLWRGLSKLINDQMKKPDWDFTSKPEMNKNDKLVNNPVKTVVDQLNITPEGMKEFGVNITPESFAVNIAGKYDTNSDGEIKYDSKENTVSWAVFIKKCGDMDADAAGMEGADKVYQVWNVTLKATKFLTLDPEEMCGKDEAGIDRRRDIDTAFMREVYSEIEQGTNEDLKKGYRKAAEAAFSNNIDMEAFYSAEYLSPAFKRGALFAAVYKAKENLRSSKKDAELLKAAMKGDAEAKIEYRRRVFGFAGIKLVSVLLKRYEDAGGNTNDFLKIRFKDPDILKAVKEGAVKFLSGRDEKPKYYPTDKISLDNKEDPVKIYIDLLAKDPEKMIKTVQDYDSKYPEEEIAAPKKKP